MSTFDVIVIGGGAVAENVADRAVQGGLTAVLIESELVGGECSYWACMPSKALLRSGHALRAAARVNGARQAVNGDLDVAEVFARRNEFVHDWSDASQVDWLRETGVELIRGHGRLAGERTVEVVDADGVTSTLKATHAVVVSTGSDPLIPDIPGLAEARPWTSREATSAQIAPMSLAIIGGGVVAAELATAYASFGTKVTVLARSGLLRGQEDFAGDMVAEGLRGLGVTILKTEPTRITRSEDGVAIELADGDALTAEEFLVATGRTPRTDDLGLDTIGLKPGSWLSVDDTLRVDGFDWLYATGDVNHRALLTHQGKYQARICGDVIAARAKGEAVDDAPWGAHVATADHAAVPQVTFTDPEVASIGMTSVQARDAGLDIRVVDYDMSSVAGVSLHADDYRGTARMVVDESRGVIVGVTFAGQDVSEMLHAATIAVVAEVPIARLWHAVCAYPTMNETWLRLLETYRG